MTHAAQLLLLSAFSSLSFTAAAQPIDGLVERYERRSEAVRKLQEETTRMAVEPVVATLKRATKADPEMQTLLAQVRATATPHMMRPANAYARRERRTSQGGIVEVDLGWFLQSNAIGRTEGLRLLDLGNDRQLMHRVRLDYGRAFERALREGQDVPNFLFDLKDYVTDPLELAFVQGLSQRLSDEAMAWTVLHEIAHHKLGHLGEERRNVSREASRKMEFDADEWAFRKMIELNIPLYGAMRFMDTMVVLEQLHSQFGLGLIEEESTHPSWRRRKEQLQRMHDPLAATKDDWLMFSVPVNLAPPGMPAEIKRMTYAFPRDPKEVGVCLAIVRVGDLQGFAAIERQDRGVHLYQATPDQLLHAHLTEPHRTLTSIVTTVTNRATGEKTQDTRLAWQAPTSLFGEVERHGILLADAMAVSPRALYQSALQRVVGDSAVRRAAIASFERKTASDCQLAIAHAKGKLNTREMLSRVEAIQLTHAREMTSVLGEAGYARFQSELLKDPVVQKTLPLAEKILPAQSRPLPRKAP